MVQGDGHGYLLSSQFFTSCDCNVLYIKWIILIFLVLKARSLREREILKDSLILIETSIIEWHEKYEREKENKIPQAYGKPAFIFIFFIHPFTLFWQRPISLKVTMFRASGYQIMVQLVHVKCVSVVNNFYIIYLVREAKKCADRLAKLGGSQEDDFVVLDTPPACICDVLSFDNSRCISTRSVTCIS